MILSLHNKQKGFTIVELMVAAAVFSLMLLTTSAIIIQISRLYYKGTVLTRTQTAARNLTDSITQPIQLENASILTPGVTHTLDASHSIESFCIGPTRFTYVKGIRSGGSSYNGESIPHAVWRDEVDVPSDCTDSSKRALIETANPGSTTGFKGVDMLEDNMRLQDLVLAETPTNNRLWNLTVSVLYGERDLLSPDAPAAPQECKGRVAGSQWCARARYETKIFKRINDSLN